MRYIGVCRTSLRWALPMVPPRVTVPSHTESTISAIRELDVYGGRDPRDLPAYTTREVAICLDIPVSRVRAWAAGQSNFRAVLVPAENDVAAVPRPARALSFNNVIEIFVLDELRRRHAFSLQHLRRVLRHLERAFPAIDHPLVKLELRVANHQLFARHGRKLENLSLDGQLAIEEVLSTFLTRVDNDASGGGVYRLYPFVTKQRVADAPRTVMMDPRVAFGRPVLTSTAVPTAVIAERFRAGESIGSIAEDIDHTTQEVEEAIRFEAVRVGREAA
jgi:uncharacterized protein (DUF433 family)